MSSTHGDDRFDAKVRFARDIEACLLTPALPAAPHLLLHVQERVLRERLRRRRHTELRRTLAAAAVFAVVAAVVVVMGEAPLHRWIQVWLASRGVNALAQAVSLGAARPFEILFSLGPIASLTLLALLLGLAAYVLRDLFADPFEGLPFRRPFGR